MGFLLRAALAALGIALGLVPALARADGAIDIAGLADYVAQQDAATQAGDPGFHKVWIKLDRKLAKASKGGLAGDLKKLAAVSTAADGLLVTDGTLRGLLNTALDAADHALAVAPDEVATLVGQVLKQASRQKVLAAVAAAGGRYEAGKLARDAGDEATQIKDWRKAYAKIEAAKALAQRYIRRQGGPPSQFKAAKTARVYTVVGQGEGGFNGDGREARRTLLYFVEECRIGPDGLLYILDWNNHMLRRRTADGRIERVCGSGIPGDSEGDPMKTDLNHPSSLAFDPAPGGKIYLAAWHNHKVKVYDPVGGAGGTRTVYTIAGTIQGGGGATSGDGGLATSARFNLLPGLVRLPTGDLLVTDAGNEVVRKITLDPGTDAPNLVGTTVHTGTVGRFAGTRGTASISGDGGAALDCTLNFSKAQNAEPDGRMELSPDGSKLYVICGAGNCVRVVDLAANPPTIDRFAGTGIAGYSGDVGDPGSDGLAIHAQLNRPADIAVAAGGTVFISDSYNNVIRNVTPDGRISTYAGAADASSGTAADDIAVADAKFSHPAGLELDAHGNLYVCDRENSVIRVITSQDPGTDLPLPVAPFEIPAAAKGAPPAKGVAGTIATYAGTGTLGFNGDNAALDTDLYWPQDVAVDPNPLSPFLYVVDWNNHRIRRIEQNGVFNTVVGSGRLGDQGGEGPDAKLNHPTDITFHPATGELWIAAWHTDKVLRLDANTNTLAYMAGNRRTFSGDGGAATAAELNLPVSVKFDSHGNWYVADEGNEAIRRVDKDTGVIDTIAGLKPLGTAPNTTGQFGFSGDGGPALGAQMNLPLGQAAQPAGRICISPDDHWLYLADTGNHRIRRIDLAVAARTITTFAGNGTAGDAGDGGLATDATLDSPCDVDCDAAGNVYIADRDNNRVRRVDFATRTITTVAGNGYAGYSGDGGAAVSARLSRPCGIFVVRSGPAAGRIYVADTYNGVVRVVWE